MLLNCAPTFWVRHRREARVEVKFRLWFHHAGSPEKDCWVFFKRKEKKGSEWKRGILWVSSYGGRLGIVWIEVEKLYKRGILS